TQESPAIAAGFFTAAVLVPFAEGLGAWKAFYDGKTWFKKKSLVNIRTHLIYGTVMLSIAYLISSKSLPLWQALILLIGGAYLTNATVNTIMYRQTVRAIESPQIKNSETIRYGIHLGIQGMPATIAYWIDGILLYTFLGPQALAIYSFAIAPVEQMKSRLGSIADISLPKISSKTAFDSSYRSALIRKTLRASGMTLLVVSMYILAAPALFSILLPRYNGAVPYSQIFALSLIPFPLTILSSALIAEGSMRKTYTYNIAGPVLQIGILVALIPFFGLWGAIVGKMIGRFFNYALLVFLYQKPMQPRDTTLSAA
ncbi:MAG: polysaccharide biosynthesis C-terminal domain-containing protein, partial [Patescibacteria group bacterium]